MSTGITAPAGFTAAATAAQIKHSGKLDMALVVNDGPEHNAAAVFTRNRVVASPIKATRAAMADGTIKAVLYNSGNANACNGVQGDKDAAAAVQRTAEALPWTRSPPESTPWQAPSATTAAPPPKRS